MDFWKVGIAQSATYEMKMKLYVEYWEDYICQDHYLIKMPPFWRGFCLEAIGDPTTLGFHWQLLLLVSIQRTQSNIFIVGRRT